MPSLNAEIGSYTHAPIVGCTCNAQPGDLHFPDCPLVSSQCTCGAHANRGQRHANACDLSVYNHSFERDQVNAEMANVMRSGRRQVVHQATARLVLNGSRFNELLQQERKETDPHGTPANAPGAKLDAGKVRPSLVLGQMARALLAVSEVGTFGANKYSDGGWLQVPNGVQRYTDARDRHRLREAFEQRDKDSGLLHAAHDAWNALARLELMLRADENLMAEAKAKEAA